MVKIEFESINELKEFIELIPVNQKEEVTTVTMDENKHFLHRNKLHEIISDLQGRNLQNTENINNIIDELNSIRKELKNNKKPVTSITRNTIRQYYETQKQRCPRVSKLNKDGTFILKNSKVNGGISKWTIKDLLKIKHRIPQKEKYSNWTVICEDLPVCALTAQVLGYGIEMGYFDKYFNEWEQLQANKFQNNIKPIETENNPQKRKEKGMI